MIKNKDRMGVPDESYHSCLNLISCKKKTKHYSIMGSNAVVSGIKLHKLYPFVLHHYTTPFKELVVDGSIDSLQTG